VEEREVGRRGDSSEMISQQRFNTARPEKASLTQEIN